MHRVSHLFVRQISYLLLALFLLQLSAVFPAAAQSDDPSPTPTPEDEPPPKMDFQPPPDADKLEDFLPPDTNLTRLDTELLTDNVVQLDSKENNAVSFNNDQIAIVTEAGTFSQSVNLEFSLLANNTLTNTSAITTTIGSIGTIAADDVVSDTLDIGYSTIPQTLFQFHIEAKDTETGEPVEKFDKHLRLVVDLRQLGFTFSSDYHQFYLAYQDEEMAKEGTWSGVPVWVHQKEGLLSAEISHFSSWTTGWRPEVWGPSWTPPTVSEFSGAATYNYPVEVPPGRAGLQPTVNLSYSSRALDGAIRGLPQGNLASGWSMADIYIAREGVEFFVDGSDMKQRQPDRFRLVLNGTGYRLSPDPNADTTNDNTVRYYAKDAPSLFVERVYSSSTPNTDGIYWIVKTGDGTTYRLGYHAEAEEWYRTEFDWQLVLTGHRGHNGTSLEKRTSAVHWYVDTATDMFGNQIIYNYSNATVNKYVCGDLCGFELLHWHHKVRIATISYNFPGRINFTGGVPDTVAQLSATETPGTRIEFFVRGDDTGLKGVIQNILIYHGNNVLTADPIKEYRIESHEEHFDPDIADCPDRSGNYPARTTTRVVDSIQLWTNTDRDPQVQEGLSAGAYALPAVTFGYEMLSHYHKAGSANRPCFSYAYMEEANNGYGGTTTFNYTRDGRSIGNHQVNNYFDVEWPDIGFNYVVTSVAMNDGRNPDVVTEYAYERPCYGQTSSNVGSYQNPIYCHTPGVNEYGNIVGFHKTTVTLNDYAGNPINVRLTEFEQVDNLTNKAQHGAIGRPKQIDQFLADGNTLMSQTTNDYVSEAVGGVGGFFTYTEETTTEQYQSGNTAISISSKVRYDYETGNQGGVQYGNLTNIKEYDDANAGVNDFYRETRRFYTRNISGDNWLVGFMTSQGVYDSNGSLIYSNYNYYDNTTNSATAPTQGKLMRTSRGVVATCAEAGGSGGCAHARKLTDTFFDYDVYGNQDEITTYTDYGYRTFDTNFYQLDNFPPSDGRTTTIAYDADYNLYPVSVKNHLNHETKFAIYGFKNASGTFVGLTGFQLQAGLLKRVIDPNGLQTTYEYDPFGRLFAVYDHSDTTGYGDTDPWNGNPLTRYRYWDTTWNDPWTTTAPFAITTEARPDDYPGSYNDSEHATIQYVDGFGRVIQTRQRYMNVDGVGERDIVVVSDYNALGQVSCSSAPFTVLTSAGTVTDSCTSKDHTATTYDALGRPLSNIMPDGNQTYALTTPSTTYSFDAKNHLTLSEVDPFGRLTEVGEMHDVYDAFAPGSFDDDPAHWTRNATLTEITTLNGEDVLKVDGDGYWANYSVVREIPYDIKPGETVFLRFQFADTNFAGRLGLLTDKGGFIGIISHVNTLYPDYNIGGSDVGIGSVAISRDANVWYRAKIDIDTQGRVSWFVWQEDEPDKQFTYTLDTTASRDFYDDANFRFYIHSGTTATLSSVYLSDYQKGEIFITEYQYDEQDNLERVTDVDGNITTITYDNFGRKTSMNDPDMGNWNYEYDAVGNLVRQEDANDDVLCFYYDDLDRLKRRIRDSSPNDDCPTYSGSPGSGTYHLASYSYDPTNGIGQLDTVEWGPNPLLNNDTFSYDTLGRMDKQDRLIAGRLFTMETTSFDALHRPLAVTYPNGETVTMSYDREGANSLTAGTDSLVSDVAYNARGQLTYVDRVHSWNLDTQFSYFDASGNFRLDEIRNGSTTDQRPDFTYQYDDVGNILSMVNATNGTGTDTQTFTYDHLNRLLTASGTGDATNVPDYDYTYGYDKLGNITARTDNLTSSNSFTYNYDSTQPHAVDSIDINGGGSHSFGYDANGNMTSRVDASGDYTQLFDVENRLTVVNKDGSGVTTFYYDAAGQRVKTIEPDGTVIYTPFPGYEEEVTSEGYHWAFDEGSGTTASDSSFNNNDGTLQGSQWTTGYYGQALDFDGSNDYVQFDGSIDVVGGLTVSAWVKPEQLPTGLGRLVVSTYRYSNQTGWYLGDTYGNTDHFPFGVMDEAGVHRTTAYNGFFNQYLNQWVHVTGVFRPGEALELYINGQLAVSSTSNIPDQITPSQNFKIGARADNTTQGHWDGQIDEVRIIPRALDATEISGLMSASLPASMGGTVLADVGGVGAAALATNHEESGATLFTLVLLGSLFVLLPVGAGQLLRLPTYRTRLRLAWRRHRLTVGKVISLVSLVGLLANSFILVPGVQAALALGPVQSPWVSADIGTVGVAGSADETSGTFTLDGAGADIGGTVDAFHYVYQSLSGDGEIIANVASLTGGGATPKAGLMIRDSLNDDAIHVSALVRGNRIRVYERTTTGGSTSELVGANNGAPEWLRIERTGNTFEVYHSNNGSSWTLMQSRTVTMGTNVYIGMAVTGNSTTTLATGTFDNVSVTGGGGGPTATPTNTPVPTNTPSPTPTSPGPTPTPTATASPTPPPPANEPEVIVQRTTYSIVGQAVFLRIRTLEDGVEVDNRLYAMHTDHLGSTSTLSYLNPNDGSAGRVMDSRAFYTPFGDYRLEPTGDYTDRGYTGHLGNNSGSNDIGLIYMNARFYVPYINRFASADTIVPDPTNPQSFNRYSYVENNPINFSDPSGHCKNGRGTGPGTCQVLGAPDVSIGMYQWYENYAPIQRWEMSDGALELFIDAEIRGNIADAYGLGGTVSAAVHSPVASIEVNFGKEYVTDFDTGETTLFWVFGGDVSFGFEGGFLDFMKEMFSPKGPKAGGLQFGFSPYVAAIYNVNDVVSDYPGPFEYNTTSAAYGVGGTWGTANVPGDTIREFAHSNMGGLFFGTALSVNKGRNYYVPVSTSGGGRILPEVHLFDYIMGLIE